jgi:ABC-type Fe3+/spermidine/putrescine transport system ATPase subunit
VRYAEQVLFNLEVVRQLEKRRLKDCVELIDWGMQLEDWEEHTPEQLSEAIDAVAQLARHLLATSTKSSLLLTKPARQRPQRQTSSHLP